MQTTSNRIAARWHSRKVNPPGRFFQIALWRTQAVKQLMPDEWRWVNSHLKKLHDNGCKTPSPLKRKEIRNEHLYPKKCIPPKKWQTLGKRYFKWISCGPSSLKTLLIYNIYCCPKIPRKQILNHQLFRQREIVKPLSGEIPSNWFQALAIFSWDNLQETKQ